VFSAKISTFLPKFPKFTLFLLIFPHFLFKFPHFLLKLPNFQFFFAQITKIFQFKSKFLNKDILPKISDHHKAILPKFPASTKRFSQKFLIAEKFALNFLISAKINSPRSAFIFHGRLIFLLPPNADNI
jgi:hypothetical protein